MSLKGSLSSVNLTEIFQMLSLSGREGTLFIYDGPRKRAICFTREGVSIRSRERNESNLIGKILVRLGRIEESHLQGAVETRRSGDKLLGDTLVEMGACTSADVDEALRLQSEEEIQELFLNRSDAQFEYVDGFFPDTEIPYVSLNVNSLLIDIARRTDEWEYIRRRIRGPREIYRFTGAEGEVDAEVLRECYASRVDPFIDGSNSIGDIIDVSYVNKFHVCKLMAAYLDAGIIELVPADAIRQNARLALRMGDAAAAIRHFEYLMGTGDFPLDILGEAAEAHEANRDFPEAAALLRRLAEELVRAGDYRGAIDVLRRVANYPRPEPEALRYLIDLVFENPRAAAEFAVNIVEAGKTLVSCYITQEQPDEAIALLQRLLQVFPDEVAFALSLVDVHAQHGNVPQACEECERLASSYQKRRQAAHAATLYKRLLALDGERQDIRDRLRKISSGRRRRVGPALPRIAVALGIALLLGGVAIVWVKQQGVLGQPQPGREEGPLAELLGRASEEKAGAVRAGAKAATIYTQLLEDLRSNPFQGTPEEAARRRDALLSRIRTADENYQEFRELADKARSIAEMIRKQTTSGELLARTKMMLDTLDGQGQEVETARRQYAVAAQKAAAALKAEGEAQYIAGKLLDALPRFELAKQLAVDPQWREDPLLQQKIDNIRADMDRVAAELKKAKAKEEESDWTSARRIYLDLLKEYKNADIVADLLLPVEILTLPQGATILLDDIEYARPTPTTVRLNPHKETKLELRRKSFRTEVRSLGPFSGEEADPAKYTYIYPLLRTATWERALRDEFLESDPVAWSVTAKGGAAEDRVAVATRSGRYHILDATSSRTFANDRLDVDGVAAGLATNGRILFIPALDGRLFFRDAKTGESLGYVLTMDAGIYAAPVVHGNVVYVVDVKGTVAAFDFAARKLLWKQATPTGVRSAPVVVRKGLFVLSTSGDLSYLDLETGAPLMEPMRLDGSSFACPPAVVDEDLLIFAAEEGALMAFRPSKREVLWRKSIDEVRIKRTPPVQGPEVYVSRRPGHLLAFDVNTSQQLYEYVQNPNAVRSAVYATGRIFFVHDKTLTCFGPRQDGYGLAWTFQAKGRILAGPVVRENAVYIGDDQGNLYRLEATD